MTVKKDASRRWVELEYEVPGSVDRVWQAIATGPGISSWFVKAEVEEREGGAIAFDVQPGVRTTGAVTAWEPPHRFAYEERDWMEGAPPLATECIVEARSGGICVVRLVHSLFATTEDWDDQLDGFGDGWPAFFRVLARYLMHFDGQPCAIVQLQREATGSRGASWQRFFDALGLAGDSAGARVERRSPPALVGTVVETITTGHCRSRLLKLDQPAPGSALLGVYTYAGKEHASLALYLYGAEAAAIAATVEPQWQRWMAEQFA